ncbi:MAG: queuosine precursor transporter [Muribaculum sp.]|nr:queuosine precursor transporter [Muribaculum sp.]
MKTTSSVSPSSLPLTLPLLVMTVLFCSSLIVANIVEIKTVDIGFITITAGLLVFPVTYLINDCVVEVYGFRMARLVIWLGFAMNLFVTIVLQVAIWLPGSPDWTAQQAMQTIYGTVPRILAASFLAFVCGSFVNARVMSRMKIWSDGRNFSLRAIISTVLGEGCDSIIFFPLAFAGTLPWNVIATLIVSQTFLKTIYEILILPLTVRTVRWLKRLEGLDTYDHGVRYTWW